jgi:hypothetical protein
MHIKRPSTSVEPFLIYLLKVYLLWITSIWAMLGKPFVIPTPMRKLHDMLRMPSDCWSAGVILYIMLSYVIYLYYSL